MTVETLAAETRRKREAMEAAKRQHMAGSITYDDLATAARAFCAAFDAYHRAKFGKPKRLDFRACIR